MSSLFGGAFFFFRLIFFLARKVTRVKAQSLILAREDVFCVYVCFFMLKRWRSKTPNKVIVQKNNLVDENTKPEKMVPMISYLVGANHPHLVAHLLVI